MKFQLRFYESCGKNSLNVCFVKCGNMNKYKMVVTTFVNIYSGKLFLRYSSRVEKRMELGDVYL